MRGALRFCCKIERARLTDSLGHRGIRARLLVLSAPYSHVRWPCHCAGSPRDQKSSTLHWESRPAGGSATSVVIQKYLSSTADWPIVEHHDLKDGLPEDAPRRGLRAGLTWIVISRVISPIPSMADGPRSFQRAAHTRNRLTAVYAASYDFVRPRAHVGTRDSPLHQFRQPRLAQLGFSLTRTLVAILAPGRISPPRGP